MADNRNVGALYCYRCDIQQREGTKRCRGRFLDTGRCGSVAFYRVRRGARPEEDAPPMVAEAWPGQRAVVLSAEEAVRVVVEAARPDTGPEAKS